MRIFILAVTAIAGLFSTLESRADIVIGFEELSLAPNSFYNGNSGVGTNTN